MSRACGRDVAVAMRDCGISTTSQTRPVCKHCFSALPIDKTSSVGAQIGLLWRSFAHLPGVGLKRKTPRGCIQISESRTRGVARIPRGLSRATSQRDSPIWIQPLGVFRYKITVNPVSQSDDCWLTPQWDALSDGRWARAAMQQFMEFRELPDTSVNAIREENPNKHGWIFSSNFTLLIHEYCIPSATDVWK